MASSKTMQQHNSNDDEMLASIGTGDTAQDDNELLESVDASAAEAWRPTEDGEGVVGEVVGVSQIQSEFSDNEGNRPWCPVITIRQHNGTQWRIVGFQSVLRGELSSADPKIGDTLAVKYFGKKSTKDGKRGYANYGVKIRRA